MSKLTKSNFLKLLEGAVQRVQLKKEPETKKSVLLSVDSLCNAAEAHANDLGLLVGDTLAYSNPVVSLIVHLSRLEKNHPLNLYLLGFIETAWEYFDEFQPE